MRSSKAEPGARETAHEEIDALRALGFGPDSLLMNEPKLFVDTTFLAALKVELEDQLGAAEADFILFQIGVIHGLRDAMRISTALPADEHTGVPVEWSPLAMRFGAQASGSIGVEIVGTWPDAFEAKARLAKLGATDVPSCSLSAGYTTGWLSGTLERDVVVVEHACGAAGDEQCQFVARETGSWLEAADERARTLVERVSLDHLRSIARDELARGGAAGPEPLPARFDPADPAVHVWGPVMVMPYGSAEQASETLALLAQDPSMRGVRVVVIDLCGETVDDALDAAGLEQLIEQIQSWGAEIIMTGISPLSDAVVSELEATYLVCRKDLPEAVAYAFQIADAQRHLL